MIKYVKKTIETKLAFVKIIKCPTKKIVQANMMMIFLCQSSYFPLLVLYCICKNQVTVAIIFSLILWLAFLFFPAIIAKGKPFSLTLVTSPPTGQHSALLCTKGLAFQVVKFVRAKRGIPELKPSTYIQRTYLYESNNAIGKLRLMFFIYILGFFFL